MSAILLSWKYLTQHKTVWTWPFLRAIGDLWVLERYDIYLDFQNGWSQKVKQRRNSVFISQIWNRKIVEIKSFPGAESPHLSRWSGNVTKVLPGSCLEFERVMAWYQSKRDRKIEEVRGIIRVPSAAARPYAWQREILVTLFHTYGVEGGRWLPVGAKNPLIFHSHTFS